MNKQDLILDFIDGKINPDHNDVLFEHLHYDDAARAEFTQQMQILLNINKSVKVMPVPTVVTNHIFTELGIKTNYWVNALQRLRKSRYVQASAIIIALFFITFSSFYVGQWYNETHNNGFDSGQNLKNNFPLVSSEEIINKNQITQDTDLQSTNNNYRSSDFQTHNYLMQLANLSIISNSIETYYRNYYNNLLARNSISNTVSSSKKLDINQYNSEQLSQQSVSDKNTLNKSIQMSNSLIGSQKFTFNSTQKQFTRNNLISSSLVDFLKSILPEDYKYEITLTNISTQAASPTGLDISNNYQFDLNARYNLNNNSAFGLNVGYDNFPQEFIREIQGKQITQIQSPNLIYLGITYRYNYFQSPTNPLMIPYFDLMLGGTQVGPLVKAQIGANFPVWNGIALNIGFNNSLLIYNVDNNIYSTNKLNFVYGINIKL